MRWSVIAGVLGALLPTLALAQVKVVLGDGVSVVFPGAPVKMHMTVEPPVGAPPGSAPSKPGGPPMPAPPDFRNFGSADSWMLHQGRAMFTAMAMSPKTAHADLPARCLHISDASGSKPVESCRIIGAGPAAMRETRRVFDDGNVMMTRFLSHGGHAYMVTYMRMAPQKIAKLSSKDQTPSEAAGEGFLASFTVEGRASR